MDQIGKKAVDEANVYIYIYIYIYSEYLNK